MGGDGQKRERRTHVPVSGKRDFRCLLAAGKRRDGAFLAALEGNDEGMV
jgi:hypothetical protein